ncbi:RNA polymerase sigma factor [Rubripirellula amarantea]|uniref:RNA polymerase sigma factor n=1 Tax=Rubripirellula amarantea TaxID=2527999 RepID=A0A5C5WWC3_9BACT|nr:RNA polymerase sigma factor [Rubripirellula amarantea]TWT54890.1 RNA polymerase sigma factor [Rubripirellula amarantea]
MASSKSQTIEDIFHGSSGKVFASLARLLGDLDLAEDAMQEAFASAFIQWPREGIPDNPTAWLISTGRFKAIDLIRRQARLTERASEIAKRLENVRGVNESKNSTAIEDDQLRLIFTCCHPAIASEIQVPLTLREVCRLTTEEIASAFLTTPTTMAQRLVRGKAKIREAGIPIEIPDRDELPERLDGVLVVIYLIFNEGYSASAGQTLIRGDLTTEAIRLCRLVLALCPDAEVMGLLALMLLHESRRNARTDEAGDIVLLDDQDRSLWDQTLIREGRELVAQAFATRHVGPYTLQAAISALHAEAPTADKTDWVQIVGLYDLLSQVSPGPIVKLNRAVAVAMRNGPAAGLFQIDSLLEHGELSNYALAHSARGELLSRIGRFSDARKAFQTAMRLSKQSSEQRFLAKKLSELDSRNS